MTYLLCVVSVIAESVPVGEMQQSWQRAWYSPRHGCRQPEGVQRPLGWPKSVITGFIFVHRVVSHWQDWPGDVPECALLQPPFQTPVVASAKKEAHASAFHIRKMDVWALGSERAAVSSRPPTTGNSSEQPDQPSNAFADLWSLPPILSFVSTPLIASPGSDACERFFHICQTMAPGLAPAFSAGNTFGP